MARFTFSINGLIDLEPISFDKVDKFYSTQNEFLRDSSVLTSTSRYSEMLHLATFAFDVSKAEEVNKLSTLIGICRSFPYVFIKSEAIEERHLNPLNLAIGSGYFMYAIREYEIEMNSSNDYQGVVLFSIRIQMVNWRPLARSIRFININARDRGDVLGGAAGAIKSSDATGPVSPSSPNSVEYVNDPDQSSVLIAMVEFYKNLVNEHKSKIVNEGMSRSFEFNLGWPVIMGEQEVLNQNKSNLVWGKYRTFRALKSVDTSNTGSDFDKGKSVTNNMSEVSNNEANRWDEESRIHVGWIREHIAGTAVADKGVALQSLVVRRRNRFANQIIQGYVYPYCQYLGHSPTELMITTITNHEKGMMSNPVASAIQRTQAMTSNMLISFPALKGLDVMAVENPIVNAMGLEYVILDSTQSSTAGASNNVLINNHTFIESDSYGAIEASKYVLASRKEGWNDSVNKGTRLLELMNKKVENDISGAADDGLSTITSTIEKEILKAINLIIEADKNASNSSALVKKDSFLANMVNTKEWKTKSDSEKAQWAIGWYVHYDNIKSATGSEERVKQERLRKLESAVNSAYRKALTGSLSSPIAIKALREDAKKEEDWIAKNEKENYFLGHTIPDLRYEEVLSTLPSTQEYPSIRDLPALPFIYDVSPLSGEKILSLWEDANPIIDRMIQDTKSLVKPGLSESDLTPVSGAAMFTQLPDGTVSVNQNGKDHLQTSYNADVSTRGNVATSVSSSGSWLPIKAIVNYTNRNRSVNANHKGIDLACPIGTPVYAASDGTVVRAYYQMNNDGSKHIGGGQRGYGNVIFINHPNGYHTRYAHLSKMNVRPGQTVRKGQLIGLSGATGGVTGPHLHYEIRHNGKVLEPNSFHARMSNGDFRTKAEDIKVVKDSTLESMRKSRGAAGSNYANGVGSLTSQNIHIQQMVWDESIKAGVDPNLMLTMGYIESARNSYDPKSRNPKSGASGIYQIMPKYYADYGVTSATVWDPVHNIRGAIKHTLLNINRFKKEVGRSPTAGEVYIMHQQGYTGSRNLFRNPNSSAASIVGTSAVVQNGGHPGMTARQLVDKWGSKANGLYSKASGGRGGEMSTVDVAYEALSNVAAPREKDPIDLPIDPIPWTEEVQAKSRIENMVKDLRYGIEKLIPTYKVYLVHGNNENSILHILNYTQEASYYEVPAVRNLKIEMANQGNPVAIATFEVLNPLNTSSDPKRITGGRNISVDMTALESEEASIVTLDTIRMKAGNKIQIRMGYGNDPNKLPVVFNGIIIESDGGEVLQVAAEGYGRELQNELNFFGDVLGVFTFLSDVSNTYISAAVAKVLKSSSLQHFGKSPKWFTGFEEDYKDTETTNVASLASGIIGDSGFKGHNSIWNSSVDEYFWASTKGPTDVLENFWLMNVDMCDRFFTTKLRSFLPGSVFDLFPDFHVNNKTTWETITTGRRMFASSIALVKNLEGRCTTFTGIKEQMMIGKEKPKTLASQLLGNLHDMSYSSVVKREASASVSSTVTGISLYNHNSSAAYKASDQRKKAISDSADDILAIAEMAEATKTVNLSSWIPATNFHIISDSHNLISNQLKLNQNCITGVQVEYGDIPENFKQGELDLFEMNANAGLMPAYVKKSLLSDSSVSSEAMAIRTGQGYLLEELERMYDGAVIVSGNPLIAPGDYAYISDDLRQMKGVIKCREVQHVFNEYDGYVTIITPGMYVEPSTHMYSNLYMKFGIFCSFIATALSQYRTVTTNSVSTGNIYGADNTSKTNHDAIWKVGSSAIGGAALTGATGYAIYAGAKNLFAKYALPAVTRIGTGWITSLASKAGVLGSSVGSKFLSGLSLASRAISGVVNAARTVMIGGGFASAGMGLALTWGAIVLLALTAVVAIGANIVESALIRTEYRHRPLLKLPVRVYEQEYTAGLFGWNNELTPIELQIDNIKRTARSLGQIFDAASDKGVGTHMSVLKKVMTE